LVEQHRHCALLPALTDRELAYQLAAADLFVLATRTRPGRHACGEGFGLVLLEAQVAGTPVIAPAYGGSHDAYVAGLTGAAPVDESAEALSIALDMLLQDRERLARMGKRAAEWAREAFAPEQYAPLAVTRLL
jgi:glycosyltransferase involved in cell wall biosynthesis